MAQMMNSLIKITEDFQIDFSFMDKVQDHMVGLKKKDLM
jgi:hypothetical protein